MCTLLRTSKFAVLSPDDRLPDYDKAYMDSFEVICGDISFELSQRKANISKQFTNNLTYGEITCEAIKAIVNHINIDRSGYDCRPLRAFYDLGSGSGRAVVAAALCNAFNSCIGIEISSELHNLALTLSDRWKTFCADKFLKKYSELNFIQGSFLELSVCDWLDGDVIFINSTCFNKAMMDSLSTLCRGLRLGSYVITLTHTLSDAEGLFKIICEDRLTMSWGMADVFIHKKVS